MLSLGFIFWLIMLLLLIFGLWHTWPNYPLVGMNLVVWILLALLGWKVFGPMIGHG